MGWNGGVIHSEAKDMYHSFFICTFMIYLMHGKYGYMEVSTTTPRGEIDT